MRSKGMSRRRKGREGSAERGAGMGTQRKEIRVRAVAKARLRTLVLGWKALLTLDRSVMSTIVVWKPIGPATRLK